MAHETPVIAARRRDRTGSRYAQRLRNQGRLPGVVYGHGDETLAIDVDHKEMFSTLQHGAHVIDLDIEGDKKETCLVKDLQFGYLGDNLIHVDFTRVNLQEVVEVNVHIAFSGEPEEAEAPGAVVNQVMTELPVRCKVSAIPDEIPVDLSKMEGTSLTAGEILLPAGVELDDEPTSAVVSITFIEEEAEPGEAEAVAVDEGEPEVISESREDGEGEPAEPAEEKTEE